MVSTQQQWLRLQKAGWGGMANSAISAQRSQPRHRQRLVLARTHSHAVLALALAAAPTGALTAAPLPALCTLRPGTLGAAAQAARAAAPSRRRRRPPRSRPLPGPCRGMLDTPGRWGVVRNGRRMVRKVSGMKGASSRPLPGHCRDMLDTTGRVEGGRD